MKTKISTILILITAMLLPFGGCTADVPVHEDFDGSAHILLSVILPNANGGSGIKRAPLNNDFPDFDMEDDRWGTDGENMETLRIIIIDGKGNVEHNAYYKSLNNATTAGQYEYEVSNHDTKTIIFVANEGYYSLDEDGMEIAGGVTSLSQYLDGIAVNTMPDLQKFRDLTVGLKYNSPDEKGLSFKKPLLITAIYTERIDATEENNIIEKEYLLHRAAVKYSFRIINKSETDYILDGISINRISDREFLLPNATYTTNDAGHLVIDKYNTPATSLEQAYTVSGINLSLPTKMTEGVTAIPSFYVPEGKKGNEPQKVSIALNGTELDVWRDLKWIMPNEDVAQARPMSDLPRNSHVVVYITINDNSFDLIAEVQPYAEVKVNVPLGLDRDPEGNIIVNRHDDNTYDVIIDGETVRKDLDGDKILKVFTDKTLYCLEEIPRDYIHDSSDPTEKKYEYYFEKDYSGGNMIIVRQVSLGGQYHGEQLEDHDHDMNDRPLYVLNSKGEFLYVTYDEITNDPIYHNRDMFGDSIVQVTGYQFRNADYMEKYIGTYVSLHINEDKSEVTYLRHCQTGALLDWDGGRDHPLTKTEARHISPKVKEKAISVLSRMRDSNSMAIKLIKRHH